jgi:hypothetical protein
MYRVHVVAHHACDSNWLVEVTRQQKKQAFSTQEEAIRAARQMAIDNKGELFVHNQQGQIEDRSSFASAKGIRPPAPGALRPRGYLSVLQQLVQSVRKARSHRDLGQLTRKRCIRRIPTRPRGSAIKGPTMKGISPPTAPPRGAP